MPNENDLNIQTFDGKTMHGQLRGSLEQPLIIFVHGFTGDKNEHIFYNGARFFEKQGYSSYRFNLYSFEENARKLEDCTLSLHAKDLDTVVSYFRNNGVKKLFVIGHSFGGLTVLMSKDKNFDKAVLWEPSVNPAEVTKGKYIKDLQRYYVGEGELPYKLTIGKSMYEENQKLKPFEIIKDFNKPLKIIVGGKGTLINGGKKYYKLANNPKKITIIPGATHCFDEDGTEKLLFEETFKWLLI